MNYYLRNNYDDFLRWCKEIVPYALFDLYQFQHGKSIVLFRRDYDDALQIKSQLYAIRILLNEEQKFYFEESLLNNKPIHRTVKKEYENIIFSTWKKVCFRKDKPQIRTIDPVLLGGKLRALRKNMGIPAKHVAELVNISENTLYSYEEGIRMMRLDTFYKLCQIYNIAPEEII